MRVLLRVPSVILRSVPFGLFFKYKRYFWRSQGLIAKVLIYTISDGKAPVSVYIDDAYIPARVGRITSLWCHLTADSSEELLAFARKIGLKPQWIQYAGTWKEHFDLTETRRLKAVELGAIEISYRQTVHLLQAKKQHLKELEKMHPALF